MAGNMGVLLLTGLFLLSVFQAKVSSTSKVAETSLPDGMTTADLLCKLRKTCSILDSKLGNSERNLQSKKRICQLADQAALLEDDKKCEQPGFDTDINDEPANDDKDLTETLCELSTSCVTLALTPYAQTSDHEPIKNICKLADEKMKTKGDISCKPIGPEDSITTGESTTEGGPEEQPQTLTISRTFADCSNIHAAQSWYSSPRSGVYTIKPAYSSAFPAYCDMATDGGGWTVIQRRYSGYTDFNRPYNDYRYGFGHPSGEHWLGLEKTYRLTDQSAYELYIELVDWSNNVRYARYSSFRVGASSNYQLSRGSYSGNAGDGLMFSNGRKFSARDIDRDDWSSGNCAANHVSVSGAWWYGGCGYSSLNGPYIRPSDRTMYSGYGIWWPYFTPSTYKTYLKKSKMIIRPTSFRTATEK